MNEIEIEVRKIVSEQLSVSLENVTLEKSFIDDLGADSLDTVELIMALEDKFELEISEDDAEQINTVQNAIDYIVKHKA